MTYTPITPFRRTVDAALVKHHSQPEKPLPPQGVNKWEVLRELGAARKRLGVTDRELIVLQALLSFYPKPVLGGNGPSLVVHPSNVSICERLNGMPCSTMRRHLSGLVHAGLITRRDSPNGKRYARRYGDEKIAFGFDLTPLVHRHAEICDLAEAERAEVEEYKRLRQSVSLMRRDLAGLAAFGLTTRPDQDLWGQLVDMARQAAQDLRRLLSPEALGDLRSSLLASLDKARGLLAMETDIMSTNASHSEQHYQNSSTDPHDLEPCLEQAKGEAQYPDQGSSPVVVPAPVSTAPENQRLPNVPLGLVLAACAEIKTYTPDKIHHWHDFVAAADRVRPMMGISPSAWQDAMEAMGPEEAAVVIAGILERFTEIKSPGGYLRHLTRKAEEGTFSCGPMVMALMRREAA